MTTTTSDWLLKAAFWLPLLFCTWMALAPQPPKIPVFKVTDVVLHAFAFSFLSFALIFAYPKRSMLQAFIVLLGYGAFIELVQSQQVERTAEWKDLGVDALGIFLGLILARYFAAPVRSRVERLLKIESI
jgi:VanZ family protein